MRYLSRSIFLISFFVSPLVFASENLEVGHPLSDAVANVEVLAEGIVGGGAPDMSALKIIKDSDFKTVIDLRTPEEGTEAERKQVESLSMTYVNIPMSSREVSAEQVEQLQKALKEEAYPVFIHCHSGGRVNALWSEYQNSDLK